MRNRVTALTVALATILGTVSLVPAQTPAQTPIKHPMTFEDMMKMRRLGDTDVSPDGKWLIYSVTDVDLAKNTKTATLWLQPISGGEPKLVPGTQPGDSNARFSHDGKYLLFESSRSGKQQIYLEAFNPATGEVEPSPRQLTTIATEADNALWSPDGKSIVFTSAVYPGCPAIKDKSSSDEDGQTAGDKCNADRDAAKADSKVKAQIWTHLLYKHWNAFTGDKRSHLFQLQVATGAVRDLTPNDPHDVPPFSLEGGGGFAFSPDSKELAFTENLDEEPAISTNADIFTLNLTNLAAKPVKISTSPGVAQIFLVHRSRQNQSPGLPDQAAGLRSSQEIPSKIPDPRRPARRVGRCLELPLERRTPRRQRLRRHHDQPKRLNRLRPGLRRWRQRRLGRQTLHRPDDRPRLRREDLPLHRQEPRMRARASYGGYMANWILGHTNRFKCIVTHDGMFNPESAYGSTEELWFNEWEFKGKPWDYYGKPDSENPFRKWSPALSAKNFKTPTLSHPQPARLPPRRLRGLPALHHPPAPQSPQRNALLPRRRPLGPKAPELRTLVQNRQRLGRQMDNNPASHLFTIGYGRRGQRNAPPPPPLSVFPPISPQIPSPGK
jgi:Tol biopolymer transport system component